MHRFIELVIRVRRLVARAPERVGLANGRTPHTAKRQVGESLTQFSFRLAFMIDIAYVSIGALGGAAVGRATSAASSTLSRACVTDSTSTSVRRGAIPDAAVTTMDSASLHIWR